MASVRGGDAFEANLKKLSDRIAKGKALRVGFLESATHINHDGETVPTAYIAALQNYGYGPTPPRPFFSNMVANESSGWGDAFTVAMEMADNDTEKALTILGEHIAGQLRESIVATVAPPLSDITLMLRKMRSEDQSLIVTGKTVGEAAKRLAEGESVDGVSTKPLVDSGQMLNAVDFEVTT